MVEWRWRSAADRRPAVVALLAASLALGALLFAGALSQNEQTVWPGFVAGAVCAAIGAAATVPLLLRVRARLDAEAAGATALFADGAAIVVAGLSVLAPPLGLVFLLVLLWLLISGRRRQPSIAGLRRSRGEEAHPGHHRRAQALDARAGDRLGRNTPALKQIREEKVNAVEDCVASFPSVTPVCAATITTGVGPDQHLIPSMNWYHREEGRYVEYGSSFSATRQFGVLRSLTDTVYRMNAEHLSRDVETVFLSLWIHP